MLYGTPSNQASSVLCIVMGFIAQAQHMLNQSGPTFEHIIVGDGPCQPAYGVVQQYKRRAPYDVIYREIAHKGAYGNFARSEGQKIASGDFCVYFDDDNAFYPHALATLYAAAHNHIVGTALVEHWDFGVPTSRIIGNVVRPGHIDSACYCVRRDHVIPWENLDCHSYAADFHWIEKVSRGIVNHVPVIIANHLIERGRYE